MNKQLQDTGHIIGLGSMSSPFRLYRNIPMGPGQFYDSKYPTSSAHPAISDHVLTVQDIRVFLFYKENYQTPASSQCWER